MNEMAFAAYLLDTLLQEVFHSKHKTAQELDVTLRTLQLNMKAGKNAKGANRATLWAVYYCFEHGIDIQDIYNRFIATKKGGLFRAIKLCPGAICDTKSIDRMNLFYDINEFIYENCCSVSCCFMMKCTIVG